jgi:anti-sigma regulatory factor (Ser/Thr protein kinase)
VKERHNVPDTAEQTITLPAEPASAARAREFVRMLLRGSRHRQLEDAALLCVTELVANVSVHTCALECVVTIVDRPEHLLIEVADRSGGQPVMETAFPRGDHGRGLRIVDALAGDWGVREEVGAGKCVWLHLCEA